MLHCQALAPSKSDSWSACITDSWFGAIVNVSANSCAGSTARRWYCGWSVLIEALAPLLQELLVNLAAVYQNMRSPKYLVWGCKLQQSTNWANAQIAEIPGLSNIHLINRFSLKDYFVEFDIPFGMSPCRPNWRSVAGCVITQRQGYWQLSIPCVGGPCSHLEVTRWGNDTQ